MNAKRRVLAKQKVINGMTPKEAYEATKASKYVWKHIPKNKVAKNETV